MDITETYIKMCDHPKIQKEMSGRPKLYLAYYLHRQWQVEHDYLGGQKLPVLLPMQDQIQEMMGKTDLAFCLYQEELGNKWGGELYRDRDQIFAIEADSPEQIWLAFYMHEKHGLIWNGDKWQ